MTAQDTEYRKLHHWLINNFGYANKCEKENCRHNNPKRFEWALIHGKTYEYKRENFMMLCPSCHRLYDYEILTEEEKVKFHAWKKGRFNLNGVPIEQFTLVGDFVKSFPTLSEASRKTGIIRTSISNNLLGSSMSSGGYKFKYAKL